MQFRSIGMTALLLVGWLSMVHAQQAQPAPQERQRPVSEFQRELAVTEGYFKQCKIDLAFWADQTQMAMKRIGELEQQVKDLQGKEPKAEEKK